MYRQGDLLFVPVKRPERLGVEVDVDWKERRKVTVAEGEVTGHKHELAPGKGGALLVDPDGLEFFRIMGANGLLTHPEHDTIELPEGDYQLVRQMEFDDNATPRYVLD